MPDPLQDLQSLKQEMASAQRARAKREADIDNLEARLAEVMESLREKFGVHTVAEAQDLLISMERDLQVNIDKLRLALQGEAV